MDWIDRFAYSNRLRHLDPFQKMLITGMGIGFCLIANQTAVGILTALWMAALLVFWAKIPPKTVLRVITTEIFLLLTTGMSILFSVQWGTDAPGALCIGRLCLSVPAESSRTFLLFLSRALGCLVSLNFLSLTTPMPDLLEALHRLGLPSLLVDLMGSIYRQIFVLIETLEDITTAQKSRLGYASLRSAFTSTADLAANLFVEVLERSERTRIALEARGFNGEIRMLTPEYAPSRPAILLCGLYPLTVLCLWGGQVLLTR